MKLQETVETFFVVADENSLWDSFTVLTQCNCSILILWEGNCRVSKLPAIWLP